MAGRNQGRGEERKKPASNRIIRKLNESLSRQRLRLSRILISQTSAPDSSSLVTMDPKPPGRLW